MSFLTTRIADKVVLAIIAFSLVITLVFAGIQAYVQYRVNVSRVEGLLAAEADSRIKTVSTLVSIDEGGRLQELLEQLTRVREVQYAAVTLASGRKLYSGTMPEESLVVSRLAGGMDRSPLSEARLELVSDLEPLRLTLIGHFSRTLLLTGLWVFCVAGFTLMIFQRLVARHLISIAQQVKETNIAEEFQPVVLQRSRLHNRDEFDQLVDDINTMQGRSHRAYQELGRSEQRLLLFFEATEEGILGVERNRTCSFANDACLRILGLKGYEEVLGASLEQIFAYTSSDPEHEHSGCLISEAFEKICSVNSTDGVLTRGDGSTGYIALRAYPVFSEGECTGAIAFFRDIGRERRLNQERALLSEAVRQAPVMVVITGQDFVIDYVNPDVERTTGFTAAELIGSRLDRLVDLPGPAELKEIDETLGQGRPWSGMLQQRTNNGRTLMLSAVFSSIVSPTGNGGSRVCVFRDMTYELQLQKQLINSRKMEAVDRLSSSIAHELGNPLFGIRSVIKDLRERETIAQEDRELLDMAYQECTRMGQLVRELRSLDKGGDPFIQLHHIDDILEQVFLLTRYTLEQKGVTLSVNLHEDTPSLLVDRKQLVLAIINIISNSVESMSPGGGTLSVKTFLENGDVVISIGDTGAGIAEENRELIFEPFFSTKADVEGSGLGLTVAYSIVRGLGGDISLASETDMGTTISIHLPIPGAPA